ncbi:ATP-binding cassette domain-containing protein [Streptomyces sp. L2]|uniref:ATP-binding cassette domain-containing protein n=1 Tax=Streptomyces sp. L2 TaxID=2162665 RepID=UPI00321FCB96
MRELRAQGVRFLRGRWGVVARLGGWSVLEAAQTFVTGYAPARALDAGFLAGNARLGLLWLAGAGLAVCAGAYGTGRVYGVVAALVEPARDRLVERVVARGVREADSGALSRLTQQVEIARDTLAGLVMLSRSFLFTAAGALIGLFSLAPLLLVVVVPPVLAGLVLFAATLRPLARRQERFLVADEALAAELGAVGPGLRDITAAGAQGWAAAGTGRRIEAEVRAARALARWSVVRVAALAVGGQLPVVLLLAAAPWLLRHDVTPGALVGALAYVTQSLLPALQNLVHGLGTSGSRLTVILRRLTSPAGRSASDAIRRRPPAAASGLVAQFPAPLPGTALPGADAAEPSTADDAGRPRSPAAPSGPIAQIPAPLPGAALPGADAAEPSTADDANRPRSPAAPSGPIAQFPAPLPGTALPGTDAAERSTADDANRPRSPAAPSGPIAQFPAPLPGTALPGTDAAERSTADDANRPRSPAAPSGLVGQIPAALRGAAVCGAGLSVGLWGEGVPALELFGVTFAYGAASAAVLDGLDLVVPPGGHLAVVGPSGVGKSTLAGLVAGLLEAREGAIRVFGRAVPGAEAAGARVLIPQEAYVHGGTLAENLGLFRAGPVPEGELLAAAEAVGLGPHMASMGGLGARVDPAALSAGERQLIALTRAYLSPAPLALLDEATCHLDPEAEERAERAFAARPGGTLVVVAHRISSARRAARVLVLDGPRTAYGTHDELLRTSALYRDLVGGWTAAPAAPAR